MGLQSTALSVFTLYVGREVETCAPVLRREDSGLAVAAGATLFSLCLPEKMQPHFWQRRLRIIIIRALRTTEGG